MSLNENPPPRGEKIRSVLPFSCMCCHIITTTTTIQRDRSPITAFSSHTMRKDSITLPTIIAALIVWAKGCQAFVPFLPSTLPTKTLISPATFHRKLSSSTIEASKSLPKTNDCLDCNIIEAMPPMESAIRKVSL